MARKKKQKGVLHYVGQGLKYSGKGLWFVSKKGYEGVKFLVEKSKEKKAVVEEKKKEKKRPKIDAEYDSFRQVHNLSGDFDSFEDRLLDPSKSSIGIVIGARGTGKSAIGMRLLENIRAKTERNVCALGFGKESIPSWITVVDIIDMIPNGSFVLIDEAGIEFGSRDSMSSMNKLLSSLLFIARHKDLSILFISQNCLPAKTKIQTPLGIKTLDELNNEGELMSYDFDKQCIVSTKYRKSKKVKKRVVKIHLEDGRVLLCSAEHRWPISNKSGKFTDKKTKDIKIEEDYLIDVS